MSPLPPHAAATLLVLALAAGSLIGCAAPSGQTADRSAGTATVHPRPPGVRTTGTTPTADWPLERELRVAFDVARKHVSADAGVELSSLTLRVVGDAAIDARVRRETERLVAAQFSNPVYARRFVDRVMSAQSGTYAALFVAREDAVLVSERALRAFMRSAEDEPTRRAALLALMIHEAVHAADDRRHDIDRVRTLDFRAAFTQSAVFEGHAQWATRRLCAVAGCLDGLDALDRFMFGEAERVDPVVQSGVALSRNLLEYAYVEGERFISEVAQRRDGEAAVQALLTAPPLDPIQILDPVSWPDDAREQRNAALLVAARTASHPWNQGSAGVARRATVAASPLKGVNLRHDPERRQAALDGFTRLLVAMSALELHDQSDADGTPVAVTLLQAESSDTAQLFARTLHANNRAREVDDASVTTDDDGTRLLRTVTLLDDGIAQHSVVAVRGPLILQLAGNDVSPELLDDYARATFARWQSSASLNAGLTLPVTPSWRVR